MLTQSLYIYLFYCDKRINVGRIWFLLWSLCLTVEIKGETEGSKEQDSYVKTEIAF